MVERTLTTEIETHHPIAIVRVAGFMAQLEVYKLKSQLENLFKTAIKCVVFDLTKLEFIDSAGIGAITQVRNECNRLGGELVLTKPVTPQVVQALNYASLGRVMLISDDVAAAMAHLRTKYGFTTVMETTEAEAAQETAALVRQVKELQEHLAAIEQRLARLEQR